MKPFLILQLRPEDEASDDELAAFMRSGGLKPDQVHRIRIEQAGLPKVDLDQYSGVIVGGGPYNVSDSSKPNEQVKFEQDLFNLFDQIVERDFPYLGECYGLCIMGSYLKGRISKEKYGEDVGAITVSLTEEGKNDHLLSGLPDNFRAFVGHKEACQAVPPEATLLATAPSCPAQMIRFKQNIYATQFHPELDVDGLSLRIKVYKHAGYFPPDDADKLIAMAQKESVTIPEAIFKRFINNYSQPV